MRYVLAIMGLRRRRVVHVVVSASLELVPSPFSRPSMDQSYLVMPQRRMVIPAGHNASLSADC
jgi:hypothetical protein